MANEEYEDSLQTSGEGGASRAVVMTASSTSVSDVPASVQFRGIAPGYTPPLNLPGQVHGLPTAPSDRGDETQDRFRYQSAMAVVLLAEGITRTPPYTAIWCEHHEDLLVELSSGNYRAVQVKTDSAENAKWRVTAAAFVSSIARFCELERHHGAQIEGYEFCSNAPVYVPDNRTESEKTLSSSPMRLSYVCRMASAPASIPSPYSDAFKALCMSTSASPETLFAVLRKLEFREGPALRGYLDILVAKVIPALPKCATLSNSKLKYVRDELMRLVEVASGIPRDGIDGVLAYIASNGRPEPSIRGKCITIEVARASVEQASQSTFRYVRCGERLALGQVTGQKSVLHKKLRNAYLDSQFEPLWSRAIAAEQRLMERALNDPEGAEALLTQLEGTVLAECKDAEAFEGLEPDERKRGLKIYQRILTGLAEIAKTEPEKVEHEPKETLIGVAGMLSGSCRFAWGVNLDGDGNGT